MPVILEKVFLVILLGVFLASVTTNPWGLDTTRRVSLAIALLSMAIFVAQTIHKSKPDNKPAPTASAPINPPAAVSQPAAVSPTAKPPHHPATAAKPKPVLHWQGYMGNPAITSQSFKVATAEASSIVSLFLQNEGNANLTGGTLYIKYESGYEVVADKDFKCISIGPETAVRGISIDIPTIRPAPAEPFRFNLTINGRKSGSSVPNWTVTSVMKLYIKVDAAEIPNGLKFHELEVTHR